MNGARPEKLLTSSTVNAASAPGLLLRLFFVEALRAQFVEEDAIQLPARRALADTVLKAGRARIVRQRNQDAPAATHAEVLEFSKYNWNWSSSLYAQRKN